MSNDRLRAAITKAGLQYDQLAELVGVDAKTVERWVAAGRTPYTRTRVRVAKVLNVSPHQLWPDTNTPSGSPPPDPLDSQAEVSHDAGGATNAGHEEPEPEEDHGPLMVAAYAGLSDPAAPNWQSRLVTARTQIDLLDISLLEIVSVPGIIDLLAAKGVAGCPVRIMIGCLYDDDPADSDDVPEDGDENNEITIEIDRARRHLRALADQPGVYVRDLDHGIPLAILRVDDRILFCPGPPDRQWGRALSAAPLLDIPKQDVGLFEQIVEEFEQLWDRADDPDPGWFTPPDPEPTPEPPAGDESPMSDAERQQLTGILTGWEIEPQLIADTLRCAVFGPGSLVVSSDDPQRPPGVAIVSDPDTDPQLAALFDRRRALTDNEFVADWAIGTAGFRAFVRPGETDALVAYTIEITRPLRLIRTFLFVAANNIHALTWLARKGTNIWLIPKALAVPDPTEPTAVGAAEFYDTALPLGETLQASETIRAVLEHAGHPTT